MPQERRLMGKWFVWFWIVAVIATLLGMQLFMFDRSKGKPSPKYMKSGSPSAAPEAPTPAPPPTAPH
jgi:hypothetical protein